MAPCGVWQHALAAWDVILRAVQSSNCEIPPKERFLACLVMH